MNLYNLKQKYSQYDEDSILKVLYEDNHIIAVVKPASVLTQADGSGEKCLMDIVKDYLKEKYKKPGNIFLGLVHRLDKPVQGIVLFAKTSKGASRLSEQFRNHTIQKTYHAVVFGKPKMDKGEIKEKINKISFFAEGFAEKSDKELLEEIKKATKTRTAELSWEVIKCGKPFDTAQGKSCYTLLKVLPKTGRFHQIRVQMANMGNPILGDRKYIPDSITCLSGRQVRQTKDIWKDEKSIALAATGIVFKTATGDKQISLEIPLPEEWKKYI